MTVDEQEKALQAQLAELQRIKAPRQLIEALDEGWLPQGTRLVAAGAEEGRVIVFTPEEAAEMVEPLRKIVLARIQEKN